MQHLASPSSPAARATALRTGLWALSGAQLVQGLLLLLAPGSFYRAVADFGPENHHDLRDMAAFYLATAVALAIAAGRPSWRAPVLAVVGLQYLLHGLNHVLDAGSADPSWVGPFDAAGILAAAVLVGLLYRAAAAQEPTR